VAHWLSSDMKIIEIFLYGLLDRDDLEGQYCNMNSI